MGDAKLIGGLRVKISVKHAARVAELELEAGAFAYLERGIAETADELRRVQADEDAGCRSDRGGGGEWLRCGRLRRGGAACDEESGGE